MSRKWRKRLTVLFVVNALLVVIYDRAYNLLWVGSTDLEIQFVGLDAQTGKLIPHIKVNVTHSDRMEPDFELTSDESGIACRELLNITSSGRVSGFRFTNTFTVKIPSWRFQLSADGYETSPWIDLVPSRYHQNVKKIGPETTRLIVSVLLTRKQD